MKVAMATCGIASGARETMEFMSGALEKRGNRVKLLWRDYSPKVTTEEGLQMLAEDAEDLYRVMERIWDTLENKIEVTHFYVTGYSLGGFNAAFGHKKCCRHASHAGPNDNQFQFGGGPVFFLHVES